MNARAHNLLLLVLLVQGCGTVVGNPKKPKDEPKNEAVAFKVPTVDFSVPNEAKEDDVTGLSLTEDAPSEGDKKLLTEQTGRLHRAIERINAVSNRVNLILEKKEDQVQGGRLVFKNRGEDNLVSGKIQTLAAGGEYAYEAVFCYAGRVTTHMKWNEAGDRFELTRDFGIKTASDDQTLSLVSNLKLVKTDKVAVDFASQGVLDAGEGDEDGAVYTESSHFERDAAGFRVRSVGESRAGTELPADGTYDGDRYLVGQVTADGVEFTGYRKALKVACKNGFDEGAGDLWKPTDADRPRFCAGRPAGGKKFASVSEYYDTLERLEKVGIEPKANLRAVKLEDGLSCE